MGPIKDTRSAERVEFGCSATVVVEGRQHAAWCNNLSSSGMAIVPSLPLPPGTKFEVLLHLPGDQTVRAQVETVRADVDYIGVRFCGLDYEALHALHTFIALFPEEG